MHYDPFAMLDRKDPHFTQYMNEIVNAIISKPMGLKDPYWIDSARAVLGVMLTYCHSCGNDFSETMIFIQGKGIDQICQMVLDNGDEQLQGEARTFLELRDKERALIKREIMNHIKPFMDPDIQSFLSRDEGTGETGEKRTESGWDSILRGTVDPHVFIHVPQDRLEQWGSLLRLMVTQLIRHLERRPEKYSQEGEKERPLLVLLDEFASLGRMEVITNALATLRSKNVTFALVLQSLAQLDMVYGADMRKVIVDNCQYKAILQVTEPDSQEYFSRLMGVRPGIRKGESQTFQPDGELASYGVQQQETYEPLLYPHTFGMNPDVWLHTPYGAFSVSKRSLDEVYDPDGERGQEDDL